MNLETMLTIIGFFIVFVKWMVTIVVFLKEGRETRMHILRLYKLNTVSRRYSSLIKSNSF